jgi:hypothetical protein
VSLVPESSAVRTRKSLSSACTKRLTNQTIGLAALRSGVSRKADSGAMRSACAAPITFGVISENTRIRNVTATVPSASAYLLSPSIAR